MGDAFRYNLTRSNTRPCDQLCDLTIDDVAIPTVDVAVQGGAVVGTFPANGPIPSVKLNGVGFTASALYLVCPSMTTIENIRADGQLIAVFMNPKGETLLVSVLLRTNTTSSPIKTMVNSWASYANEGGKTTAKLPDNWSLTQMIPSDPAYYFFKVDKIHFITFRSMGNIDPNDYALITKLIPAVPLDNMPIPKGQEFFFNDTSHLAGVPDGKAYMRCRRVKKKGEGPNTRITPVPGLADSAKKEADKADTENSTLTWLKENVYGYIVDVGVWSLLDAIVYFLAVVFGIYYAYSMSNSPRAFVLAQGAQSLTKVILRGWNYINDWVSWLLPFLRIFRHTGVLT
jgi:hypothetical protein